MSFKFHVDDFDNLSVADVVQWIERKDKIPLNELNFLTY